MKLTIIYAAYGQMQDTKQLWSNCYVQADFVSESDKAGQVPAKWSVSTEDDNKVAKELVNALNRARGPIEIEPEIGFTITGSGTKQIIKGFKLLNQPVAKAS
ncbi:hypothetical protein [Vibrio cholerae]|uniref:hypothetical protein n=1 Tax=Vibrio cholerae TaxID=666 RepID=UPI0004E2B3DF|nr:hypothetical protein [Vibrio cholerae]EGR1263583.1 hypothetical protein [Vibrio cholerae]EGR2436886.1 hypothetical protein [Vibrio cholerae]EGR2476104.1 hypothetical protein [Vibrio cholerae]KFD82736.1 hypothetical protein DN41_3488 [Vibrio cholerae]GHZ60940.1 hypothetical protein VCSRO80_2493 [Vibrio cholerae]